MASDMINELFEVVVAACDKLYGERKLITHKAVMAIVEQQGRWSTEYLMKALPQHINEWRLQNLGDDQDPVQDLKAQLTEYQSERSKIITELRDMLNKMGRSDA